MLLPVLASALKLMTYNVLYSNQDPDVSLDAIAAADADVVLLQEVTSQWETRLEKRFKQRYPHRKFHIGGRAAGGIAVLSKHAITDADLWPAPKGTGAWFPAQRLVVDSPLGPIQIVNVHLRPAIDGGSWIKGFISTPPIRRAEIEAHWKSVDSTLPTIVAGDFNEDSTGLAVDFLAANGLALVSTKGPTSWHYQDLLALTIDHVMVGGGLVGSSGEVIDVGGSDHRPVVVTIAKP